MSTELKSTRATAPGSNAAVDKISAVTIRTLTGREIPPPPQIRITSNRTATKDLIKQRAWLIDQVRAEAEARGDQYAQTLFSRLDPKNFPPAEGASCCLYLFGETHPEFDSATGSLLQSN